MLQLRWYQKEAIDSIFDYYKSNAGNPVVAMPTGSGKTPVIVNFWATLAEEYDVKKILILTDDSRLVEQGDATAKAQGHTVGVYCAGLGRKETEPTVIYATIGSVYKKPEVFGFVDLCIIDECHVIGTKETGMYRKFFDGLKAQNERLRIVGLSATPYRMGLGLITSGGIFTDICYDLTGFENFNRLVSEGWLCPAITKKTDLMLDTSAIRIKAGEFSESDMQEQFDKYEITLSAVQEIMTLASDRQKWLIFGSGIEHCEHISDMLNAHGVKAAVVHSKLGAKEVAQNIDDFKAGRIQALVNNDMLTTGFDCPDIDCVVLLRATMSTGLFVQMVGRGLRVHPSKKNFLVLDFAGNTLRLGPINDPIIPKKKGEGGGGPPPVKICAKCGVYNHTSARFCIDCGEEFHFQTKIQTTASSQAVIKSEDEFVPPVYKTFEISHATYSEHSKRGKAATLKVTYWSGFQSFSEWVCIGHAGYAGHKAKEWWKERCTIGVPDSVQSALAVTHLLKVPKSLQVWVNKKYPEVVDHIFVDK